MGRARIIGPRATAITASGRSEGEWVSVVYDRQTEVVVSKGVAEVVGYCDRRCYV
jgi:hypothetical protein